MRSEWISDSIDYDTEVTLWFSFFGFFCMTVSAGVVDCVEKNHISTTMVKTRQPIRKQVYVAPSVSTPAASMPAGPFPPVMPSPPTVPSRPAVPSSVPSIPSVAVVEAPPIPSVAERKAPSESSDDSSVSSGRSHFRSVAERKAPSESSDDSSVGSGRCRNCDMYGTFGSRCTNCDTNYIYEKKQADDPSSDESMKEVFDESEVDSDT
jgi:hypothetical protein